MDSVGSVASSTALAALRQATAASHARIETLLRLDEDMPIERYRRTLASFEQFLGRWEPLIHGALPERLQAWFAQRSRRPFLQADMRQLGITPGPAVAGFSVSLPTLAAAWGSMYVMEGSALGGQVISRRLATRFGFTPENGAAYFHGWGEQTGRLWRQFRESLEQEIGSSSAAQAEACHAAVSTFQMLGHVFEQEASEQGRARAD